jgi:hypothetical protein
MTYACFISVNAMHDILINRKVNINVSIDSTNSSDGIALGYGLEDRGSRVRLPARAVNFCLHHRVQNGSGTYPSSYPMGTRGFFFGGKAAGA